MPRTLNNALFVIVFGAAMGALYGYLIEDLQLRGLGRMALVYGAVRGMAVASFALALEALVTSGPIGRYLRAQPFGRAVVLRGFFLSIVLLVALTGSHFLLASVVLGDSELYFYWRETSMRRDFIVCLTAGFLIQILLQARRLVGARTLRNFVLGRYARPTHENRIFVLGDMFGSTKMAEQLGDESTLALISRFFLDLDPAITRYGGEIHAYIGDEVVISWPQGDKRANRQVVLCLLEMQEIIKTRQPYYQEQFGVKPDMRFGVAGGHVAVGECGWEKRQVLYIGDTINTAKRLQEQCKKTGDRILIDAQTATQIALPKGQEWRTVGATVLRGRTSSTELLTLA